ncbi:MAG: hypothetical protein VW202_11795, partial [Halieaceae bacterium]
SGHEGVDLESGVIVKSKVWLDKVTDRVVAKISRQVTDAQRPRARRLLGILQWYFAGNRLGIARRPSLERRLYGRWLAGVIALPDRQIQGGDCIVRGLH